MADETSGKKAVMREAIGAAAEEFADLQAAAAGEQGDMFGLPSRFTGDRLKVQERRVARSGPQGGRPKGSPNLSSAEFRRYLLSMGVSPLTQMMRWSMHTPESLASELGCTKYEAFRELRAMWEHLSLHLHSRVAPTDDKGNVAPLINLSFGAGVAGTDPDASGIPGWMTDGLDPSPIEDAAPIEENQSLSEDEPEKSHDEKSHE